MKGADLRSELLRIKKRRGKLTPQIVLDEARKPSSPLHGARNWLWDDDAAAADQYRKSVAQELLTEIQVVHVDATGSSSRLRAFYAVRAADANQWEYETTEDIGKDPFLRKVVLSEMRRRIDELVRTYEHLEEFWLAIHKVRPSKPKPPDPRKKRKAG